jgi:hypothetical protein
MSNPISKELKIGTIGELLVQLRLLQYNIQASQPIKDSGNDLIAIKGKIFKSIQVKTILDGTRFDIRDLDRKIYDLLALVVLCGFDNNIELDRSKIFILTKENIGNLKSFSAKNLTSVNLLENVILQIWQ